MADNWYKTGSWTLKLNNILCPASHKSLVHGHSTSRLQHSPGDIWRRRFSASICNDLASTALSQLSMISWRRFIRVEHIGISGVVLYEISVTSLGATAETVSPQKDPDAALGDILGSLRIPNALGIDVDDLLDAVGAKIVYFPTYACTSFIIGQAISSFFSDLPAHRPFPASIGSPVCMGDRSVSKLVNDDQGRTPQEMADSYSLGSLSNDLMTTLSLEEENSYASLCIRTSTSVHSLEHTTLGSDFLPATAKSSGTSLFPLLPEIVETFMKSSQTLHNEANGGFISFLDFSLDDNCWTNHMHFII